MSVLIKPYWKSLTREVWSSLERTIAAPGDMYVELLRFARRKLDFQADLATDDALSDPKKAREEFLRLPAPSDESSCVVILEGFYGVLEEFNSPIAAKYREKLAELVGEYNLRYSVSNDCRFKVTMPGLLVSHYERLSKILSGTGGIEESWKQLEGSASRLADSADEKRNCIAVATNLLEGIACLKTTNGQNTLSAAIDGCNVFPHEALRRCVKDFYKFASDYPNIRHAGTLANKIRALKNEDALLAMSFAIAFSCYLFDNDSAEPTLEGDF